MTSRLAGAGLWATAPLVARRKLGLGPEYVTASLDMCRCCEPPTWCSMTVGLAILTVDLAGGEHWGKKRVVVVGSGEVEDSGERDGGRMTPP